VVPGDTHRLRNPSAEEDLVYLMGGEVLDVDVAHTREEYPAVPVVLHVGVNKPEFPGAS